VTRCLSTRRSTGCWATPQCCPARPASSHCPSSPRPTLGSTPAPPPTAKQTVQVAAVPGEEQPQPGAQQADPHHQGGAVHPPPRDHHQLHSSPRTRVGVGGGEPGLCPGDEPQTVQEQQSQSGQSAVLSLNTSHGIRRHSQSHLWTLRPEMKDCRQKPEKLLETLKLVCLEIVAF